VCLTAIESTQQCILQSLATIAAQATPAQPPASSTAVATAVPTPAASTAAAPPPYSAPETSTAATASTATQHATPVALPDIALRGPSSTSIEDRMGAMEGVLQQLVAGMKRAHSPSPDGPARSIRAHIDDAPSHSATTPTDPALAPSQPPSQTVSIMQNTQIVPPPPINAVAVAAPPPSIAHAPNVVVPPAGLVNTPAIAAPPEGIVHAPAASTILPGIVHIPSTLPVAAVHGPTAPTPTISIHTPTTSTTTSGVVAAPPGGRPRCTNNASSRNCHVEARLGPVVWGQDITFEAGQIIRSVLRDYDLSTVFTRAYRIQNEPLMIVCAFQTPAHATWFISAFNASRVPPYNNVYASPN
jgi:hypothetical protein